MTGILKLLQETGITPDNILGVDDLESEDINAIHRVAREFSKDEDSLRPYRYPYLENRAVYLLFGQKSTRTRESFVAAVQSLSGIVRDPDPRHSSIGKGERLEDTLKMYENYGADSIVLRWDIDLKLLDLDVVGTPVINAGDRNEHPTQALLDSLVMTNLAKVDDFTELNYNVLFVGHTKKYRSAQSLSQLLTRTGCTVSNLVPYDGEPMNEEWGLKRENVIELDVEMPGYDYIGNALDKRNMRKLSDKESEKKTELKERYIARIIEAIKGKDFLYFCRPIKKNRYDKPTMVHGITPALVDKCAEPTMKILHPLPRNIELSTSFDTTKRALYLEEQPIAGIGIRQAIMATMLGNLYS